MQRRGRTLIVGAGVLVVSCLVLAATDAPPLLDAGPRADQVDTHVADHGPPASAQHHGIGFGTDLGSLAITVLLVGYLVFVVLTVLIGARHREDMERADPLDADAEPDPVDWVARLRADLESGTRLGLEELDRGTPRNAVIACWVRLIDAAQRVGLPADPAETSNEYAARIMRMLPVDQEPVVTLGALYREARFSAHPVTESQRREAARALVAFGESLPGLRLQERPGTERATDGRDRRPPGPYGAALVTP